MVIWSKTAKTQLQRVYNYITKNSRQNAEIVRDEIIELTIHLLKHPEKYPLDKFKQNNDGTYRAFEIYHYRISYLANLASTITSYCSKSGLMRHFFKVAAP